MFCWLHFLFHVSSIQGQRAANKKLGRSCMNWLLFCTLETRSSLESAMILCLFVFSFLTHLRKRIKRECLKFHQHVCSLQSSRDQCQMLHVHAHYFNKTYFAFCDCFIKRIADDLGLFVKAFAQRNESCSFWIKLGLRQVPLFCLIIRTTASSGLCHQLGPLEHAWVSNHTRQTRLLRIVSH